MFPSHIMFLFPISEVGKAKAEVRNTECEKDRFNAEKGVSGRRRDLSRAERLLQWSLSLRMKVEECVNVHALCFERRTRVLEPIFLIYPHYGVWGCYIWDALHLYIANNLYWMEEWIEQCI